MGAKTLTLNRAEILRLFETVLPVQVVSVPPLTGTGSSPWHITHMTRKVFFLENGASNYELAHEFGHLIVWVNARRPGGDNWGFKKSVPGNRCEVPKEEDWEFAACGIAAAAEHLMGDLTFDAVVHRFMTVNNFDDYAEDCHQTPAEWSRDMLNISLEQIRKFAAKRAV